MEDIDVGEMIPAALRGQQGPRSAGEHGHDKAMLTISVAEPAGGCRRSEAHLAPSDLFCGEVP